MEAPRSLPTFSHIPEFTLGDRLRRARESVGATQAELADELGISQRAISSYESDQTRPGLMTLRTWAAVCQVHLGWLAWGPPSECPRCGAEIKPQKDDPMPNTWRKYRPTNTKRFTIGSPRWSRPAQGAGTRVVAVS